MNLEKKCTYVLLTLAKFMTASIETNYREP